MYDFDFIFNFKAFSQSLKNYQIFFIPAHRSSCKVPDLLVRFQPNLNFLDIFSTNALTSNFMKIYSVEAELFHVDREMVGLTDRQTKQIKFHLQQK